jgi:Ca2+ transporting ATPase
MVEAYRNPASEVVDTLESDSSLGLTSHDAHQRLEKYGLNALPKESPTSIFTLILNQFQDQLTLILLASAVVSFVLALTEEETLSWSSLVDPIVILTILILNAIVGVQQESSAESAITALNEYSSSDVKVLRDGKLIHVKQEFLVPGDIIDLSVGDVIPADARIIKIYSQTLRIDQSILTGESESVLKETEKIEVEDAVKQEQTNMVFSGTTVVSGHSRAVVVETGVNTAIGDIYNDISSQISQPTPLKQKLDDFGDLLARFITVICIAVWVINFNNFNDPIHGSYMKGAIYYFKIAVALAVAAIPEGLSVVITTCLALGTKKMAKQNAIVRSLSSVETLGSTNVICSDKTGTLTTNQMVAHNLVFFQNDSSSNASLADLTIYGHSFDPKGKVVDEEGYEINLPDPRYPILHKVSQICSVCNDSNVVKEVKSDSSNNEYSFKAIGEPTEAALKILVEKLSNENELERLDSITPISDLYVSEYPRLATFEFTRDRKSMSVLTKSSTTAENFELLVKGAPENIIARSASFLNQSPSAVQIEELSEHHRAALLASVGEYSAQGYRVIALAYNENIDVELAQAAQTSVDYERLETNLIFVGFAAIIDPPRPEVSQAIKECKNAGIKVIVITGDSPKTAESIAKQIGIFEGDEEEEISSLILTGKEFHSLSEEERLEAVAKVKLFARVEPVHKSILVDCLQQLGNIVAMTGDGVNDAPALKKADIGISMGSGTDVARLASDLVLQDDNFATIVNAVKEGRLIYNNTRQFIRYLISSNIGEVVSIFLTAALGLPEALIPVQLLWVNLVTDGLPASALGFNPPDLKIMSKPPKSKDDPLVSAWLLFRFIVVGTYVGVATVFGYVWYFTIYENGPLITFSQLSRFHHCSSDFPEIGCNVFHDINAQHGSTISLSILVIIEMLNAMNSLSESDSLLTFPLWNNVYLILAIILSLVLHVAILYVPWLATLFQVVPLNKDEWIAVIVISLPVIALDELFKLYERAFVIPKTVEVTTEKKNK